MKPSYLPDAADNLDERIEILEKKTTFKVVVYTQHKLLENCAQESRDISNVVQSKYFTLSSIVLRHQFIQPCRAVPCSF